MAGIQGGLSASKMRKIRRHNAAGRTAVSMVKGLTSCRSDVDGIIPVAGRGLQMTGLGLPGDNLATNEPAAETCKHDRKN